MVTGLNLPARRRTLSNWPRRFLNCCLRTATDFVPTHCILCGADSVPDQLCAACAASLPHLQATRCAVCAVPLASGEVCGSCLDRAPAYERIRAVYAYAFPVDALVHAYKYGRTLSLAPLFAESLACEVSANVDVIIPMPLGPARLRERGFNQAHELARRIGRALGVPVKPTACRKVSDTPAQASLPWKERARNVRGAFVCDAKLQGQRVAIIDDVMTTGATMNELAAKIKSAGAVYVEGWVLARTPR